MHLSPCTLDEKITKTDAILSWMTSHEKLKELSKEYECSIILIIFSFFVIKMVHSLHISHLRYFI